MRSFTIVAVVAAGVLAAGTATAIAGTSTTSPGRTSAAPVVRLITGDAVSLRHAAGRTAVSVRPRVASGAGASWTTATVGGDVYVLPAVARPYLGGVLDPALFDVSTAAPGAPVPVDVGFTGARPSVPGFTATSATATSLHGYVSASGTRTFGAALAAQWRRDVAARTAPSRLFGATRIARAGVAPGVHPDFPQVTLVLKAQGADGSPAPFAIGALINTDDARKYANIVVFSRGEARVSVPIGNYSLIADAPTFDPTTFALADAIVTVPDFTVTTNLQRVAVDFGTATTTPSVRTPQPATLSELDLTWLRSVPHGGFSFGSSYGPGSSVKVAPAPAPVHGQVDWETQWSLTGAPVDGLPYRYDLAYLDQGAIPADQTHIVSPAQLAQIDARYYSVSPYASAAFGRTAFYPFDDFIFTSLMPTTSPLHRTEYLSAPPSAKWSDGYIAAATEDDPFAGFVSDEPRTYPAGSSTSIDWLRGPLAPGMPEPTASSEYFFCPACRTGNELSVYFAPFVDTTSGHAGSLDVVDPDTSVATFSLYRNGKLLVSEDNSAGDSVQVPAGNATYKAVEETYPLYDGFARSTHAVTELTFASAAGTGAPAPANWLCGAKSCSVLPVLTATVPLPTDLTGTLPLGATTVTFTIDPMAGAPARTVNTATMSISLDGGSTYRTVPVTALGQNRFQATITHPAADAGASVTLRVAGRDTSGDAITQTVDDAYLVASS